MKILRCEENPIIVPGKYDWRAACAFNPGVVLTPNGIFYLYERAARSLRPFVCSIGLLSSKDGIHFEHVHDTPILTADMVGYPQGTVQDPRISLIDGTYYMTYALEHYHLDCWPNGIGVPEYYYAEHYREWRKNGMESHTTQSGIVSSKDGINFQQVCFTSPLGIDDRDNILFPEKINGKFALLRRPIQFVGPEYGTDRPGIWITYTEDFKNWSKPELVACPQAPWEYGRIGGSTTPIKTDEGWLTFYHGVDSKSTYRLGAMILDLKNPANVIARSPNFIMEPETYYERFGLVIPNVIFPTDNVVKDGQIYIYYGCCDVSIGLAIVGVDEMVKYILSYPV